MWAIWAVAFFISLKSTQMKCLEKGRSWQSTQGPTGWAVKWEVMLPPCCSASADVGTCRKWERLPALGLASEAAGGLLVSLQGHEICVSVHFKQVWGLSPNFKSVWNSDLKFRSVVWHAIEWQWCFLSSGSLQVRPVISYPGVIWGKVSKDPGKGGVWSLSALWGMCASSLRVTACERQFSLH